MSDMFKVTMKRQINNFEHIKEFGDCIGTIVPKKEPYIDWPEVEVMWEPSGLKYLYLPENLEIWDLK